MVLGLRVATGIGNAENAGKGEPTSATRVCDWMAAAGAATATIG